MRLRPNKVTPRIVPNPANGTPTAIHKIEQITVAKNEKIEKMILKIPTASNR
jgi:hypothetical protein